MNCASYGCVADIAELLGRTLVLVAHPDDETAGCGALLQRIAQPVVAFVTDGAPKDEYFWGKYGSRLNYQRVREEEARAALSSIGVSEIEFLGEEPLASGEGIADQELCRHMPETYERLSLLISRQRPNAMLALAYEGGHPDHDCCSILGARLGTEYKLPIWEFPLYHRATGGNLQYQQFLTSQPLHDEVAVELSPEELAIKQAMLNAYASQHPFLLEFDATVERFRRQINYDYTQRPHAGTLNYEAWGWKVTGEDVCAAYRDFANAHSGVSR